MTSFNDLLRSANLDPATVRLARHQDLRSKKGNTLFFFWEHDRAKFEQYQCIQSSLVFKDAKWIASFVATPPGETLFVGMYAKRGVGKAPAGLIDPITHQDVGGYHFYDLTLDSRLAEYAGKVIVEWGAGYRAWVQKAHKMDKPIIQMRKSVVTLPSASVDSAATPSGALPADGWIFQYNPDNNPDLETHIQVGTILTWHVGQHAARMKPGQKVYLWRAAGKQKRLSGIIASSILQEEPKTQRQFTHPAGGPKTFDPGGPEFCAPLKIERVFLEKDKMLGKETIQQDDILKEMEIVTMARHTNYVIEATQVQQIVNLLKLENVLTVPVYEDFGEAPNDDPNELRIFAAKVRRGQPQFREKLVQLYSSKCAITGTEIPDVLEACHILLHSKSGINHSGNGILLRSDIHVLFDGGWISIDPNTLTVIVDPALKKSEYGQYHGKPLPRRSDGSQISKDYLKKRAESAVAQMV